MPRDEPLVEPGDTFGDKCHKFLRRLREMSGGDQARTLGITDISGAIGLDAPTALSVAQYLHGKRQLRLSGEEVSIASAGIDALEAPAGPESAPPDPVAIKVLYEQFRDLRIQVERIEPEAADKPGRPGTGISVLIPAFNTLLERAKGAVADNPSLRASIEDVHPVAVIQERLSASAHKTAKEEILLGSNLALKALAPRLMASSEAQAVSIEREGLFVAGQHFDALQLAVQLLSRAQTSIVLIDAYIDHRVLRLLSGKRETVRVSILTRTLPGDVKAAAGAFNKQYGPLEIRTSDAFHDRFLIIDDKDFYHFGASLKDLGNRGFMFSRIEEPAVMELLRTQFAVEWDRSAGGLVG